MEYNESVNIFSRTGDGIMKFRVGLIGCGRISPMHLQSIKMIENCSITAVCDINQDIAKCTAEKYNCNYYTNYLEMLDKEALDTIHICTPHYLHHEMAIEAAKRGIHVITEKPMAINYNDAVDMVNTCNENNVTLSVLFQNRYNRGVQVIRDEIQKGNLGKVLSGRVIVTWNRSDEYYLKSDWKGTWEKEGGGVVIDQAIHSLDLVRYIVGKKAIKIDASIRNRNHKKVQVEDCAEGIIYFEDDFTLSFYTMNYFTSDLPIDITIHCERGTASIIGDEGYIEYLDGRRMSIKPLDSDKIDYGNNVKKYWGYCHYALIRKAYENIALGKDVEVRGEDCLETQKIINSIYESGLSGHSVLINK